MTGKVSNDDEELKAGLSKRLRWVLKSLDVAERRLSIDAGLAPAVVGNIIGGEIPRWTTVARLVIASGVDGHWLLTGQGSPLRPRGTGAGGELPDDETPAPAPYAIDLTPEQREELVRDILLTRRPNDPSATRERPTDEVVAWVLDHLPRRLSSRAVWDAVPKAVRALGGSKTARTRKLAAQRREKMKPTPPPRASEGAVGKRRAAR